MARRHNENRMRFFLISLVLLTVLCTGCKVAEGSDGSGGSFGWNFPMPTPPGDLVGDWNGTLEETSRDDGNPLQTIELRMQVTDTKDDANEIGRMLLKVMAWFDNVLIFDCTKWIGTDAILSLSVNDPSSTTIEMTGTFSSGNVSGTWSSVGPHPDNPEVTLHINGTFSVARSY